MSRLPRRIAVTFMVLFVLSNGREWSEMGHHIQETDTQSTSYNQINNLTYAHAIRFSDAFRGLLPVQNVLVYPVTLLFCLFFYSV